MTIIARKKKTCFMRAPVGKTVVVIRVIDKGVAKSFKNAFGDLSLRCEIL
jgi:hypothetical protein